MRVGSLCSGYGGLDLAVGGSLAWTAETDRFASLVLDARFPGVPNLGDLTQVDWESVEPVDVVTAGYPCQPFSHAGRRRGEADERHVWPGIADALRVLRPRRVVLENVAGHLRLGFDSVLGDLAALGFDAEWMLVRASDVGAPHRRERLFVLARDTDRARADPLAEGRGPRDRAGEPGGAAADAVGGGHGAGTDAGGVGRLDAGDAGEARQRQRARQEPGGGGGEAAPHPARELPHGGGGAGQGGGTEPADGGGQAAADPGGAGRERACGREPGQRSHPVTGDGDQARRAAADPDSGGLALDPQLHRRVEEDGAPSGDDTDGRRGPREGQAAADPDDVGRERRTRHAGRGPARRTAPAGDRAGADWGPYTAAVERWETVLGRPAPLPTADGRLSALFVEWMMGLEEGWVTAVPGISRTQQLKILGNGVVPRQAAHALALLMA